MTLLLQKMSLFCMHISVSQGYLTTTKTTYSSILCKELQNQDNTIDSPYIPSRFDIFEKSGFGKPSPDHIFTSETCFKHTFIHILKSYFFLPQDLKTVLYYHPLCKNLSQMLTWSKTVDFSSLKNPIANFSEQHCIATSRVKQFLAAVLHYDIDLPTVIRSLGCKYTGEYRDTSSTLKALRAAHCDEVLISECVFFACQFF